MEICDDESSSDCKFSLLEEKKYVVENKHVSEI
jgi:hypothetical protein